MIKINRNALLGLFFFLSFAASAQTIKGYSKVQVDELSIKVEDQVRFLEFLLNTVGSSQTSARDKDVIIRESYLKIFRDAKVQVEDDLLLDRKVVTNKDVTAYFKDIEFFYKNIEFKFKIKEIKPAQKENGDVFFLASLDRTITAVGLKGEKISNTKLRFVEVNLDEKSQELKIASIYTTKVSRDEELKAWWTSLDTGWKSYFKKRFELAAADSVPMAQLYRFVSVDSLNLSGDRQIRQLTPLAELRDLKFLDISNTAITNLAPIANITFLESLNLANTPTADIKFIKYADKLQALDISATQIEDISELLNLKSLTTLRAEKAPIQSFAVLNEFKNLKELQLSESGFNNMEHIKDLVNLERLVLSKNFILNFSFIAQLGSLQELNLSETNLNDLSPLSGLSQLTLLDITATSVADLEPVEGLRMLKKIAADEAKLTTEEATRFVRSHPDILLIHHVKDLEAWWQSLSSAWKAALQKANPRLQSDQPGIDILTQTLSLNSLNLDDAGIETLVPVGRFISLEKLSFSNNPLVTDLLPLSEVKTLQELRAKKTGIQDLSVLKDNTALVRIDVEGSPVSAVQDLTSLPKLVYLNVNASKVDQESIPAFLLQRPDIVLIYRSAALSDWWNSLPEEWKLAFVDKMGGKKVPSDEDLHTLTARADLSFERVAISNLEPLLVFSNLRKLSIFDAPLMALAPLSQLTKLTSLRLSQIPAVDYLPLATLLALTELDLSNTGLEELVPLTRLVNLKKINLAGSNISSLKGMEALVNLEELDVASTDLRSLKALEQLGKLKKLTCFNTRLTSRAVEGFKEKVPGCDVRFY
jgi:hypothetical protein